MLEPLSPEDYVTIVGSAPGRPGLLEVFDESVNVTEIQRFTMNDQVFGYLLLLQSRPTITMARDFFLVARNESITTIPTDQESSQ